MKTIEPRLRAALARRVPCGSAATGAPGEIGDDVELTPLQVVLIVLDVEPPGARARPMERIAGVRTVGELRALFCADAFEQAVVVSLARYLTIDPDSMGLSSDLRNDLRMATLDIQLVLLRLENVAHVEFPNAGVALVRTVGDLADLFRAVAGHRAARIPVGLASVMLGAAPE